MNLPNDIIRHVLSFTDIDVRVTCIEAGIPISVCKWWQTNECPDYDILFYMSCMYGYTATAYRCLYFWRGFINERRAISIIIKNHQYHLLDMF